MRVRFVVTPVGLMMGNIESARQLKAALIKEGVKILEDASEDCDMIHVHTPVPPRNMRIMKRARQRGIPVVAHAHTTTEDSMGTWVGSEALSGLTSLYLTHFYNLADLVLAPSAWTRSTLIARGVRARIEVISNGVDLGRFKFDEERRERFRSRYGIPGDAVVVYSIGVMCLKKGIEIFPEISKAIPDVKLVWVGRQSKLYHPLRVRKAILKCGANASFLHDVEDILDAHCGGDVFFTPSFTENQGMAVMEALAVGRPVVARDLPSYEGLLIDGRSALLSSSNEGLVMALDRMRNDSALAGALVREGQSLLAKHDLREVARQMIGYYESLLEGKRRTGVL